MKKILLSIAITICSVIGVKAADLNDVWTKIAAEPEFISAHIEKEKANKQGFEDLTIALKPNADSGSVKALEELTATISENQRLASSTNNGITVSIYAAPADAQGNLYNVMYTLSGESGGVSETIVLYGKVTRANMARAMTNINIEDLIGV